MASHQLGSVWVEGVLNIPTHDRECLWEGRKCTDHHDAYWIGAGVVRRGCDKHFNQPKDKATSKSVCGLLAPKVPLCVSIVSSLYLSCGFPGGLAVENPAAGAGDVGSALALGRYPGEGNGYPFQYSFLGNCMDQGAWLATVHEAARESDTTCLTIIAASQTCVSFYCTTKWISHKHTYSPSLLDCFLCYTVCSH